MGKATLAIDGHVHLYPVYDLPAAVHCGVQNLRNQAEKFNSEVISVWLLVERSDANFFEQIYRDPGQFSREGLKFDRGKDDVTITVARDGAVILYLFAGRQLVTSEGLEVLSLVSNLNIPDRQQSMDQVIQAVKHSGGIPALNWAPGKWFFQRGQVVARQIATRSIDEIFIGETTLRHTLWPAPKLIQKARKKGFPIIAGSDPLPFPGEERGIGSYGFLIEGEFDPEQPSRSLRNLIDHQRKSIRIIGKRNNVFTFARRQFKIMMEKRSRE